MIIDDARLFWIYMRIKRECVCSLVLFSLIFDFLQYLHDAPATSRIVILSYVPRIITSFTIYIIYIYVFLPILSFVL